MLLISYQKMVQHQQAQRLTFAQFVIFYNFNYFEMKKQKFNDSKPAKYNQFINLQQISTPRYSQISSQYFRNAQQYSGLSIDQQILSGSAGNTKRSSKAIKDKPAYLRQLEQPIRLDSQEFQHYFHDDDSLLSLNEIFPEEEFRMMARQLEIQPEKRQSIVNKFYNKNVKRYNQEDYNNKYYLDYLNWKQNNKSKNEREAEPSLKIKTLQDRDNSEKRSQLKKYEIRMNEEKSYHEMKQHLGKIKQEYNKKLDSLLQQKTKAQPTFREQTNQPIQQIKNPANTHSKILSYQQISYPIVNGAKASKVEKKKEEKERTSSCFVSLIKNPPKRVIFEEETLPKVDSKQKVSKDIQHEQKKEEDSKRTEWRLDVDKILKIPYKEFLLFYNQFGKKIVALSSVEELKKINKYRSEALLREQALEKLKVRISNCGEEVLQKLSPMKKKQLWQLLYEDDLKIEKQKWKENQMAIK